MTTTTTTTAASSEGSPPTPRPLRQPFARTPAFAGPPDSLEPCSLRATWHMA